MYQVPKSMLAAGLVTACVSACTAGSPTTEVHRGTQTERQAIDLSQALGAKTFRVGSRPFLEQVFGGQPDTSPQSRRGQGIE